MAAYLRCVGKFYEVYRAADEERFPKKFEAESFMAFVKEKYAPADKEVLDFYLIDEKQNIVLCKRFTIDSPQRVVVKPEELTKLIVENKPFGIVAVHNHLKGNCFPSVADDKTTRQFQLICMFSTTCFLRSFHLFPRGDLLAITKAERCARSAGIFPSAPFSKEREAENGENETQRRRAACTAGG